MKRVPYPPPPFGGWAARMAAIPECKPDLYNAVPCLGACGAFTAAVTFISSPQAAINGSRGYARPEPATYFSRSSNRCARADLLPKIRFRVRPLRHFSPLFLRAKSYLLLCGFWGAGHFGGSRGMNSLSLQTVSPVPEPSSWSLVLLGIGTAKFAFRRLRRGD